MPLLLLAAHSWQLSQGSPGLRWPLAALGFLSATLGTSHQENLPQWFGMEGATKALEPLKPKPHTQPDPTTEPQVGTACGSPCSPSPQAGQDRGDLLKAADTYQPFAQLFPASGQYDNLEREQMQSMSFSYLLPRGAQAQWPGHGTHPGGEGEGSSDRCLQREPYQTLLVGLRGFTGLSGARKALRGMVGEVGGIPATWSPLAAGREQRGEMHCLRGPVGDHHHPGVCPACPGQPRSPTCPSHSSTAPCRAPKRFTS